MHEISLVQSTLELAEQAARAQGASQIHKLRIRVGALTGVVPEVLQFAFETLREGTMASEAILEIEPVPVHAWCQVCKQEFTSEDMYCVCPKCEGLAHAIRGGKELELGSLEVS